MMNSNTLPNNAEQVSVEPMSRAFSGCSPGYLQLFGDLGPSTGSSRAGSQTTFSYTSWLPTRQMRPYLGGRPS